MAVEVMAVQHQHTAHEVDMVHQPHQHRHMAQEGATAYQHHPHRHMAVEAMAVQHQHMEVEVTMLHQHHPMEAVATTLQALEVAAKFPDCSFYRSSALLHRHLRK